MPGGSGIDGKGSHLDGAAAADWAAGQVAAPGGSGIDGKDSYLDGTQAADGAAEQVAAPGGSGNAGKGSHLDGAAAADGAAGRRAQAADTDADAGRWTQGAGRRTEPALMWTKPDSQICPGIGPEADRSPIPRYGLM